MLCKLITFLSSLSVYKIQVLHNFINLCICLCKQHTVLNLLVMSRMFEHANCELV